MKTYCCDFPFRIEEAGSLGKVFRAGCRVENKPGYMDYGDQYFACDGIGKRFVELLHIVEFPPRYSDRYIYRYWYQYPDGKVGNKYKKICTEYRWNKILSGFSNKELLVFIDGDEWEPAPCMEVSQ